MICKAQISDCGRYRYTLTRTWDALLPWLTWVMLNPSTADARKNDPTIRRVIGFSQHWGFGTAHVVNLFALRATNPRELAAAEDPVGPRNGHFMGCVTGGRVLVAWGAGVRHVGRELVERAVFELQHQSRSARRQCLGLTKCGNPLHPLMLSYGTKRIIWR